MISEGSAARVLQHAIIAVAHKWKPALAIAIILLILTVSGPAAIVPGARHISWDVDMSDVGSGAVEIRRNIVTTRFATLASFQKIDSRVVASRSGGDKRCHVAVPTLPGEAAQNTRLLGWQVSGWPLRSFRCFIVGQQETLPQGANILALPPERYAVLGGVSIRSLSSSNKETWGAIIPFAPIWPALLVNICFYIAMGALAVFLCVGAKSALRQYRGKCLHCGYSRLASACRCPECGNTRSS